MNKRFIIPAITFIIGGGIGYVCGVKGFVSYLKRYLESDEGKDYMDKKFREIMQWPDTKIQD